MAIQFQSFLSSLLKTREEFPEMKVSQLKHGKMWSFSQKLQHFFLAKQDTCRQSQYV